MTSLSPFQTLPFHITDAIVQRVLENNCRYTAAVGEFADRDRQKALLWSCSNFRKVTYERLGQIYKLKPDSTTGSMESELDPLLRLSTPHGHCPRHLAKVVNVEVDLGDVLCGRALKVLRKSDSCIVFRRARVLKLTFGRQPSDTGYKLDVAEVAVNCAAFAEYINQMAPAVSEICISLDTHPRLPLSDVPHFGSLVSRLLPLAPCIQYSYVMQKSLTGLQMAESCNLAHIRCSIHPDDGEQLMLLAQLNAKTLQTLNVRSSKQVDTAGLIVDANGGYMKYPCLQTLMLDFTGDRVVAKLPALDGVAPFPCLRHLNVYWCSYPFSDDMLFRGNAATLECLSINLTSDLLAMLDSHAIFTHKSHPRLRNVKIWRDRCGSIGRHDLLPAGFLRYALGFAHSASTFDICGLPSGASMHNLVSQFNTYTDVKTLSLVSTWLDFLDVVSLVTTLPCLSDLHSSVSFYSPLPLDIPGNRLPRWVAINYRMHGRQFRHWNLLNDEETYGEMRSHTENMAACLLLLGLVCPNYYYTCQVVDTSDKISESIRVLIARAEYLVYRPQLKLLLR